MQSHQYAASRIALLMLVAVILPQLNLITLKLASISLLIAYCVTPVPVSEWLSNLWRFKWLLLSIALACLWVTPGTPVFRNDIITLPSYAAFTLAAERLLLIVCLIGLVRLCLYQLPAALLVSGFQRLASPLEKLGLNVQQASLRAALTLEYLQQPFSADAEQVDLMREGREEGFQAKISQLAENFAARWQKIEIAEPLGLAAVDYRKEPLVTIIAMPLLALALLLIFSLWLTPFLNHWMSS